MGKEYQGKTFRSGNSVAMRLPKGLGIDEGLDIVIREADGKYEFEIKPVAQEMIDLEGLWGSIPDLEPLRPEDRLFDERELDWEGKLLRRD